jgi:hypothetical protein
MEQYKLKFRGDLIYFLVKLIKSDLICFLVTHKASVSLSLDIFTPYIHIYCRVPIMLG